MPAVQWRSRPCRGHGLVTCTQCPAEAHPLRWPYTAHCPRCGAFWPPSAIASEVFPGSACDNGECICGPCEAGHECTRHPVLAVKGGLLVVVADDVLCEVRSADGLPCAFAPIGDPAIGRGGTRGVRIGAGGFLPGTFCGGYVAFCAHHARELHVRLRAAVAEMEPPRPCVCGGMWPACCAPEEHEVNGCAPVAGDKP